MAAVVKAVNAKIRSNPAVSYVCSTRRFVLLCNIRCSCLLGRLGVMESEGRASVKLQCAGSDRVWRGDLSFWVYAKRSEQAWRD